MENIVVTFQGEVTAKGEYVTSALITLPTDEPIKEGSLAFWASDQWPTGNTHQVGEEHSRNLTDSRERVALKFNIVSQTANKLRVSFPLQPVLSTLHFDDSKFLNYFQLPEIDLKVANFPTATYQINFAHDPLLSEFHNYFFQYKETQIAYDIYSSASDAVKPLVIFLHGSGERGFGNRLPLLGCAFPKHVLSYAKAKEDAVILVPQATWDSNLHGWFKPGILSSLYQLIQSTIHKYNIDTRRIYLVGLSNGGATTWHLAANHSDLFAAISPCCGYIYQPAKSFLGDSSSGRYMEPTNVEAVKLANLPIWAFAAKDDNIVNAKGTIDTVTAIKKAGNTLVKATLYEPGVVSPAPHNSWELAYDNPDLLPWLFAQHK